MDNEQAENLVRIAEIQRRQVALRAGSTTLAPDPALDDLLSGLWQEEEPDDLTADCIGGGQAQVAHGSDCVLISFGNEVGWWRNSVGFTPDQARRLAAVLVRQAAHAEKL